MSLRLKILNEVTTMAVIIVMVCAWTLDWPSWTKILFTSIVIGEAFTVWRGDRSD